MSRNQRSIVHIADYGGPYSGNFIASMQALKTSLEGAGFRLVLVFSDIAKSKPWLSQIQAEVDVYTIPKTISLPALVLRLLKIAADENAAVLHTHFTTYDIAAWLAALTMRSKSRTGVVWHVHSDWPIQRSLVRTVKDCAKWRLMASLHNTRVVGVSDGISSGLLSRGLAQKQVEVVANGIDIGRALKVCTSRSQMRLTLGISEDAFVVLAFGWEPRTKGIDTCIEASNALRREGWNIKLILVGGEQLEKFVHQCIGTASWIHIVRPVECVGDFYSMADAFFAGSRWEGFPYSVGEALACGLPVVASDVRGHEWASFCPGVVIFRLNECEEAVRALKLVMQWSPEERAVLSRASKDFISTHYSVEAWADRVIELYDHLAVSGDK